LDLSDIKLHISLLECRTMFDRQIRIPTISANNSVWFEKELIDHGFAFEISLRFPYFDEETACYLVFETAPEESLAIFLDCEELNLKCPEPPEVPCEMNCKPNFLNKSATFTTIENRTAILIQYDWEFKRPAVRYLIRHQPIWVLYENRALDVGNASVDFLQNGESHLALEPFSKVPEAAHGLQICAVYDPNCRLQRFNWTKMPTYGEQFYSLLDSRPTARLPNYATIRPTIPPPTAEFGKTTADLGKTTADFAKTTAEFEKEFAKTTPVKKPQHADGQSPRPALLRNSAVKTCIKFQIILTFIGVIWYYLQ